MLSILELHQFKLKVHETILKVISIVSIEKSNFKKKASKLPNASQPTDSNPTFQFKKLYKNSEKIQKHRFDIYKFKL